MKVITQIHQLNTELNQFLDGKFKTSVTSYIKIRLMLAFFISHKSNFNYIFFMQIDISSKLCLCK